jgi:arylsulfatase A
MMTTRRTILLSALALSAGKFSFGQAPAKPNIVYILCDDLGYGDIHALNPTRCKIKTPHIDRLASEGMSFTDAHSGSAVCTPSRYGILTGRYAWRTHLQSGVLNGLSEPLIAPTQLTVASLLKEKGYATAAIGKWHLGMTFGADTYADPIKDNPLQHGFDYYFGITASLDMPPFVYIENQRFTQVPTVEKRWVRTGPAAKDFEAVNVLPDLTRKAVGYITDHAAAAKASQPFFLYLALTAPHTPILPSPEWQGKSGIGTYGDFVMQVDGCIGEVMQALQKAGIADNTLLVFTSDNGCSPAADVKKLEEEGHYPSAAFRGYKADIWEGGHRIPFLVRWPGKVKPGTQSDAITCQTDFMATCAEILGAKVPENAGADSVSMLPALLQNGRGPQREAVVHHSIDGYFAIRKGKWKLELCAGSGGWAAPREYPARQQKLPLVQLYDMSVDSSEQKNVAAEHPNVVTELTALLEKYVSEGRSTPGPKQSNDVRINLHKVPKPPKPATPAPRED